MCLELASALGHLALAHPVPSWCVILRKPGLSPFLGGAHVLPCSMSGQRPQGRVLRDQGSPSPKAQEGVAARAALTSLSLLYFPPYHFLLTGSAQGPGALLSRELGSSGRTLVSAGGFGFTVSADAIFWGNLARWWGPALQARGPEVQGRHLRTEGEVAEGPGGMP